MSCLASMCSLGLSRLRLIPAVPLCLSQPALCVPSQCHDVFGHYSAGFSWLEHGMPQLESLGCLGMALLEVKFAWSSNLCHQKH